MAQDDVMIRSTNGAWLRSQNEYDLLTTIKDRLAEIAPNNCVLTLVSGKCIEQCVNDCNICIQRWLYQKH